MVVEGTIHLNIRIYNSRFSRFGVTTDPLLPQPSQRITSTMECQSPLAPYTWAVVFSSGVNQWTTYTYILEPQDSNGQNIGTSITGTFILQNGKLDYQIQCPCVNYSYVYYNCRAGCEAINHAVGDKLLGSIFI